MLENSRVYRFWIAKRVFCQSVSLIFTTNVVHGKMCLKISLCSLLACFSFVLASRSRVSPWKKYGPNKRVSEGVRRSRRTLSIVSERESERVDVWVSVCMDGCVQSSVSDCVSERGWFLSFVAWRRDGGDDDWSRLSKDKPSKSLPSPSSLTFHYYQCSDTI